MSIFFELQAVDFCLTFIHRKLIEKFIVMAAILPPKIQATGSLSTASATDGRTATVTAKVVNSATGAKEYEVTFSNSGTVGNPAHDTVDLILFAGAWNPAPTLDARTAYSSPGFASYAMHNLYYSAIASNIAGVRMETDNTDNYLSFLQQIEKDPTGDERKVKTQLNTYRVALGGGNFNMTLELPKEAFHPVIWSGQQITISKIKAGSYIKFYFKMEGWNKVRELSALTPDII